MKTAAQPFLGLRTVLYFVPDLNKAKAWYAKALDTQPYFDQPYYVGFNVGGFELGLHPGKSSRAKKKNGHIAYWGVKNASAAYKRLLKLGAKKHDPIVSVGEGIKVAAVADPFGNVFGLIENPNFKLPRK